MLEEGCYSLCFSPEKEKVEAVWREAELAERLQEALEENSELLENKISAVRKELKPFCETDAELESRIGDDELITSELIANTKIRLLWFAMNEVFDGKLDVKQNILEILNSKSRLEEILRERVKTTLDIIRQERECELRREKL